MPRLTTMHGWFLGAAILAACAAGGVRAQTPPPPPATIWSGVYSESQAFRGEKIADTLCIGCHGAGFTGGDSGPKLVGPVFLENWDGQSVAELFDWLRESMPEDSPGTLSRPDAAAALAYILQVNKVPAGKQDLSSERNALMRISIVAVKP